MQVEQVDVLTMLFHETGSWTPAQGAEIPFNNVYRWTADLFFSVA